MQYFSDNSRRGFPDFRQRHEVVQVEDDGLLEDQPRRKLEPRLELRRHRRSSLLLPGISVIKLFLLLHHR